MTLDELETFVAIARCGSFTEVSRRLARSQPAISRRIHQLEQSVGVPLFERAGRRAKLSAAGEALLPHAEAALAAAADGARAVEAARSGAPPARLRLAVVGTLADSHLVEALRTLEARHPGSRVEVATASSREVSALVRAGAADLGLRYFSDGDSRLTSTRLGAEKLFLVVPAGHRLVQKQLRKLDRLAGERWLGFPPEKGQTESLGHLVLRTATASGASPTDITLVDSLTAQKRLVEAGMGVALMPLSAIREELRAGSLRAIELPGLALEQPVTAVRRSRAAANGLEGAFLELLRAASPDLD